MSLKRVLCDLARRYPRYGYRMLHQMIRRQWAARGRKETINVKRIRRLCREYGLTLPHRKSRKRRGRGIQPLGRATFPNQVWAYDFVFDATAEGRPLKFLTVEDEYTRRVLALEVDRRMNAHAVIRTLLRLFDQYGTPHFLRSDNGPEFISKALIRRLAPMGVVCRHMDPGSPWQNGTNERLNGTFRRECLDLETFTSVAYARAIAEIYRRHYNGQRPHSSLGHLTPDEFAARATGAVSSTRPRTPTRPCNSLPSGRWHDADRHTPGSAIPKIRMRK